MTVATVRIRTPKAAELVAGEIRASIVTGELAPGDDLPVERDLITRFGVSRPTLREALRILETERLVEVTRGERGGARIIGPSLALASHAVGMVLQAQGTTLADVQEARQIFEPPAARLVAERRSAHTVAALRAALDHEVASSGPDFPIAAMRFHEILIDASGNKTLSAFLHVLHDIHEGHARALQRAGQRDRDVRRRVLEIHQQLIGHVESGDGDAAEQLWRDYWAWILPYSRPKDATRVIDVLGRPAGS